jgi:hypothetical protein
LLVAPKIDFSVISHIHIPYMQPIVAAGVRQVGFFGTERTMAWVIAVIAVIAAISVSPSWFLKRFTP